MRALFDHLPAGRSTRHLTALFLATVATMSLRIPAVGAELPHVRLKVPDVREVTWTTGFWADRYRQCQDVMMPNLWQVMQLPENAATFEDLRKAAGLVPAGKPGGRKWGDGDCYKCIEAMAYLYAVNHDPQLAATMDEAIRIVAAAQQPDGYLSSWIQLSAVPRWADLSNHELYNMGHLMTAACAHHQATGQDNFLQVARRLGDYLYQVFEPRPKKLAHFGFNPSNIMGAVDLYRTTGDTRYLKLAGIFVSMRGSAPQGSDQNQAHVPLRKEQEAVGHAVTAGYLWCGAADVYAHTGEPALLEALERLWLDVTTRKMSITGGIGALHQGESTRTRLRIWPHDSVHEAFGREYQLPNRTVYNETCANIANAMWNQRMLQITGDAKYADVMEQVLYNSLLSAISLDGKHFFYTNPLRRCGPNVPLLSNDSRRRWSDTTPKSEVHCFCCPPNVIRTLARLSQWVYGTSTDTVWVHLYGGSRLCTQLPDRTPFELTQITDFPWDGQVRITVNTSVANPVALRLRIPAWAREPVLRLNGESVSLAGNTIDHGYATIRRAWQAGDQIDVTLPLPVDLVTAHPLVEQLRGQAAVMRGPVVYCVESPDLPPDVSVDEVVLPTGTVWQPRVRPDVLRGVTALEGTALAVPQFSQSDQLYSRRPAPAPRSFDLALIPYFAWANRGESEMAVWLPVQP